MTYWSCSWLNPSDCSGSPLSLLGSHHLSPLRHRHPFSRIPPLPPKQAEWWPRLSASRVSAAGSACPPLPSVSHTFFAYVWSRWVSRRPPTCAVKRSSATSRPELPGPRQGPSPTGSYRCPAAPWSCVVHYAAKSTNFSRAGPKPGWGLVRHVSHLKYCSASRCMYTYTLQCLTLNVETHLRILYIRCPDSGATEFLPLADSGATRLRSVILYVIN